MPLWRRFPTSTRYVVAGKDEVFPAALQRQLVSRMAPHAFELDDAGDFPNITHPDDIASFIDTAAQAVAGA